MHEFFIYSSKNALENSFGPHLTSIAAIGEWTTLSTELMKVARDREQPAGICKKFSRHYAKAILISSQWIGCPSRDIRARQDDEEEGLAADGSAQENSKWRISADQKCPDSFLAQQDTEWIIIGRMWNIYRIMKATAHWYDLKRTRKFSIRNSCPWRYRSKRTQLSVFPNNRDLLIVFDKQCSTIRDGVPIKYRVSSKS
jgi:hypothetical protein